MIYFDNAASTIVDKDVLDLFIKDNNINFGNPSALNKMGMQENYDIINFKKDILKTLGLPLNDYEVIFTSGATEANNLAILGYARKHKDKGMHLITSSIEHPSALNAFKELEKEGFEVTYLPIKKDGTIDIDIFKNAIRNDTTLVSIMSVNNELGNVLNIEEIKEVLKEHKNIIFHSDLAQSVSKTDNLKYSNYDMMTLSAYKIHGIKGIGCLIKKYKIDLETLVYGGGQEDGFRSGTQSYPLIHSFTYTLIKAIKEQNSHLKYIAEISSFIEEELTKIEGISVHTSFKKKTPYIVNFSTLNKKASVVVEALSNKDILVSTKSSCSSKIKGESYCVKELTNDENEALNAIRLSFSKYNTMEEAKTFIETLKEVLASIKG